MPAWMTPTFEHFIVLTWLRLIHADLPKLVKQWYGTELRIRTEILQALTSLLDEIRSSEDARVMRAATTRPQIRPSVPRLATECVHFVNTSDVATFVIVWEEAHTRRRPTLYGQSTTRHQPIWRWRRTQLTRTWSLLRQSCRFWTTEGAKKLRFDNLLIQTWFAAFTQPV